MRNYISSEYRSGYKFKVEGGFIYRKDWDTGQVVKMPLSENSCQAIEEYDGDPQRAWFTLRKIWKALREELGGEFNNVYQRAKKSEFK